MVTKEAVWEALEECYDPEIPINIVDLGLVYGVEVKDNTVQVRMTLTAPGCPMHAMIAGEVKERVLQVEGVKEAKVEVVWEPRWSPQMMSAKGKKAFGFPE